MMAASVFDRLHKVLGAVRAAEEMRLAALLAAIGASRARARRLRARSAGPPGDTARGAAPPDAAGMAAEARWRVALLDEARAEAARAEALAGQAAGLRPVLASALGRERAAADLAHQARMQARRAAERRAETPPAGLPALLPSGPVRPGPILSCRPPCHSDDPAPSTSPGASSSDSGSPGIA